MPLIVGIGDEMLVFVVVVTAPLIFLGSASTFSGRFCRSIFIEGPRRTLDILLCFRGLWSGFRRGFRQSPESVTNSQFPSAPSAPSAPNEFPRDLNQTADYMESPPENDICSICHDAFTVPVQANCSHWYCGKCILTVWEHSSVLAPCKCPICRRGITLLAVSRAAGWGQAEPAAAQVLQDLAKYNRLFGGGAVSIWQRCQDMPMLLRRMLWEFADPLRALRLLSNLRILLCIVLVVLYVVSPFDVLPESVLGLVGLVDDAVVLLFIAYRISIIYRATLVGAQNAPWRNASLQEAHAD